MKSSPGVLSTGLALLADALYDVGAVKFGAFELKMHAVARQRGEPLPPLSPYFFNLRTPQNPKPGPLTEELVFQIAEAMEEALQILRVRFQNVAGVPNAGDPFAAVLAGLTDAVQIRLTKAGEGDARRVTGIAEDSQGHLRSDTLLVDDLITGADSKIEAIEALAAADLRVSHAVVLIDREQGGREALAARGCTLVSVFTVTELLEYYLTAGKIDDAKFAEAQAYLANERETTQP